MHEDLTAAIACAGAVAHGSAGEVRSEWIADAERALGRPLPPSYRWFLLRYGFVRIGGAYVYHLAPPEFRDDADIDIVYQYAANRANGIGSDAELPLFEPNGDETYFFDLSVADAAGEYPVMHRCAIRSDTVLYAPTFADFLIRLLAESRRTS